MTTPENIVDLQVERSKRRQQGIVRPFEQGIAKKLYHETEALESPAIHISGIGKLQVSVSVLTEEGKEEDGAYAENHDAYTFDEEGRIIFVKTKKLIDSGYGYLSVYVGQTTDDPEEMYSKGNVVCSMWISSEHVLKGDMIAGPELIATDFYPDANEREARSFLASPDPSFLKRLNINFEIHRNNEAKIN